MVKIVISIILLLCLIMPIAVYRLTRIPVTSIPMPSPTASPTDVPLRPLDKYKLFDLVNDYRVSMNLPRLKFNDELCAFTLVRLKQIHTDWSHNGFKPEVDNYFSYVYAGENLGEGYKTEQEQVDAWIASEGHKKNILKDKFSDTCIESDLDYDSKNYSMSSYTVQEFAGYSK